MLVRLISFILLIYSFSVLANSENTNQLRRALVIGNSDYEYLPSLDNPVNDARDIANTLSFLGFHVDIQLNASQEKMEMAINYFGHQLAAGGVGLFYYAGHGVQVDGVNYIIPANAKLIKQKDLRYKAVNVGQILDEMDEARNGLNIVILDACRDNPLKGFRSASSGLSEVSAPTGTLVAFATSPGSVAADGNEKNGTYTKHLLRQIKTPGQTVEQVFKKVLQGVNEETNGVQVPWTSSSFTGDFYFIEPDSDMQAVQAEAPNPIQIKYNSDDFYRSFIVWPSAITFSFFCLLVVLYVYKWSLATKVAVKQREQDFSRYVRLTGYQNSVMDDNKTRIHRPPPSSAQTKLETEELKVDKKVQADSKKDLPVVPEKNYPNLQSCKTPEAVAYLIELHSNKAIAAITPSKQLVLGRSKSCNVYLTNNTISAEHATLQYSPATHNFLLIDMNSSNGTWVEGKKPITNGTSTVIQANEIFCLAGKENAFYIFLP